jgi:hypothetical protein
MLDQGHSSGKLTKPLLRKAPGFALRQAAHFLNLEFTIYNLLFLNYLATLETHCKVER